MEKRRDKKAFLLNVLLVYIKVYIKVESKKKV